jgi:hypothetical protein
MIKTRTLSAAAALVAGIVLLGGAVAPANAAIPEPVKAPAKPVQDVKQPSARQLYCVQFTNTGTRIPKRDCRTRADWIATDGFDPLDPQK